MRHACALVLLSALMLAACGGGGANQGTTNAPGPANTGGTANVARNEPAPDTPKADPNAFKKLAMQNPSGWVALSKDGRAELEKHIKKLPADFDPVTAITSKKAPGGTEGPEHWAEWTRHAVGAMLYRVSTDSKAPDAAVKDYADKVAAGVPEPKTEGGVAWTPLQGGEVMLAAFNNKHGTYVVVAVIMDTEKLSAHQQAILKWAQSIKPE